MTEIVGIRFKKVGKIYYFNPDGVTLTKGQYAIVETARGIEYGEVAIANKLVEEDSLVKPLKKVLRPATPEDAKIAEQNAALEEQAMKLCHEKISQHKLEMKLVAAEYTFDRGKILFYFTSDGRVDFRDLVKDLASVFRTRIELRQIGVRDEAKMIGGLGVCGCPLCCSTFLDDFQSVSINMAKEQGLSLNPTKISGTCGRLMCCLKYENEAYQDMTRTTPPVDSLVETPGGKGTVTEVNLLRGTCKVRLENSTDGAKCFCKGDCKVLRSPKEQQKNAKGKQAEKELEAKLK